MANKKARMKWARGRVMAACRKWKPLVGLGMWRVDCEFYSDLAKVPKHLRPKKGSTYCPLMWAVVQYEYLQMTIHVVLPHLVNKTEDEITHCVRHELVHGVVNEMREMQGMDWQRAAKHEERVVETLALALEWTFNAGWNDGRADLRKKRKKEQ